MIVINVGFGMPGGGDILVMNDNNGDMEHQRIAHSVKNKIYEVPTTNAITEPVTHFNYLLNLSFDVEESPETKKAEASLNAMAEENGGKNTTKDRKPDVKVKSDRDCISIVFEVYSIGWFGRYYLEGYGTTTLPMQGSSEISVPTWKPIGSLSSRLYDYYLGSGMKLYNNKLVGSLLSQKNINRFGMVSESKGSLLFKSNVITCDPRNVVKLDMDELAKQAKNISVRKTVEDIVHKYKATGSVSSNVLNSSLLRTSTNSALLRTSAALNSTGSSTTGRPNIASLLSSSVADSTSTAKPIGIKNILAANDK